MLQWKSVAMETADQHLQDMNPDSLLPLEAKRTGETSLLLVLLAARKSSLSHCWMAGWLKTNISQSVLKDWLWLHFRCNYGCSVQNTLGFFSSRYQSWKISVFPNFQILSKYSETGFFQDWYFLDPHSISYGETLQEAGGTIFKATGTRTAVELLCLPFKQPQISSE